MKRHILNSAGDCGTCGATQFDVRMRQMERAWRGGPTLPYEIELEIAELEHNLKVLIDAFNECAAKVDVLARGRLV